MSFISDLSLPMLDHVINTLADKVPVADNGFNFDSIGITIRTSGLRDLDRTRATLLETLLDRSDNPPRLAHRLASRLDPSIAETANALLAFRNTVPQLTLQVFVAIEMMVRGYQIA